MGSFDPLLIAEIDVLKVSRPRGFKPVFDLGVEGGVVRFQRQHIVGSFVHNRSGNLGLGSDCIDGDDATRDVEQCQQSGNRRNLIALTLRL